MEKYYLLRIKKNPKQTYAPTICEKDPSKTLYDLARKEYGEYANKEKYLLKNEIDGTQIYLEAHQQLKKIEELLEGKITYINYPEKDEQYSIIQGTIYLSH